MNDIVNLLVDDENTKNQEYTNNNFEITIEGNGHSVVDAKVNLNGLDLQGVTVIHPCKMPNKETIGEVTLTFRADTVKIINKLSGRVETYGK